MFNTSLLVQGIKIKNKHKSDYVLTYVSTISVANQLVYIFKDEKGNEVRLNKPSLVPNYDLLDMGLVAE